jgi:hypothetical protein
MSSVTFAIVACSFCSTAAGRRRRAELVDRHDRVPQPAEEAERALQPLVAEVAALLVRAQEHQVGAERVGAPLLDVAVRDHDVAAALRHLRAFLDEQAVLAERAERLLEVDVAASCSTMVMKRAYSRCSTACSSPPMYMSTGSHLLRELASSNGTSSRFADG